MCNVKMSRRIFPVFVSLKDVRNQRTQNQMHPLTFFQMRLCILDIRLRVEKCFFFFPVSCKTHNFFGNK